jgi:glycosyltransferase involved in cell wall biosynthesis
MNILLIVKLSDNNLNCIIQPLVMADNVNHVYILRDKSAEIISDKVTFITEYNSESKSKLKHFYRLRAGFNICREYKIDIIAGVLIYPHGYIGRIISIFKRLPYIHITIAGQREFWFFGRFVESFNLFVFKKSKAITVTGKKTLSYLLSKGYDGNKVVVLPNVIDMNKYRDFDKHREFDIISVSSLDKNKNVSLLLKAIAKINSSQMIKALILGNGPEFNYLLAKSMELGISENIYFKGWINDEDKKIDFYNRSKLFVLCSRGEGFPLALLEGMACGCVPVITDVGDITDLVSNGVNGYILKDYNDENELAFLLELLLSSPGIINNLSARAKEVKNKYSFKQASDIWNDILKN